MESNFLLVKRANLFKVYSTRYRNLFSSRISLTNYFVKLKLLKKNSDSFNTLTPKLKPSAQHSAEIFLLGILIFKGLTARRLYKSFGVKGLTYVFEYLNCLIFSSCKVSSRYEYKHRKKQDTRNFRKQRRCKGIHTLFRLKCSV
jgi:hypothetical protein